MERSPHLLVIDGFAVMILSLVFFLRINLDLFFLSLKKISISRPRIDRRMTSTFQIRDPHSMIRMKLRKWRKRSPLLISYSSLIFLYRILTLLCHVLLVVHDLTMASIEL